MSRKYYHVSLRGPEELESRLVPSTVADAAFSLLNDRIFAAQTAYVYLDADSGPNIGFPSGKFANDPALINAIGVNTAGIDDPSSPTGISTNPNALDLTRGTVLQIVFPSLTSTQFVGLNFEEPERFGATPRGTGYDLRPATRVVFEARSPTPGGLRVQVGVGEKVTDRNQFLTLTNTFATYSIELSSLRHPQTNAISPPDLSDVHLLFGVATNALNAPNGGIVLLDNVRFEPVASEASTIPSLPVDTQTFGVNPILAGPANQPIPPDQANRNISTIYSVALEVRALSSRGTPTDLANVRRLLDPLVYALSHDIVGDGQPGSGDPLPRAPDGSRGLHSAYSSGYLPLQNDQLPGQGLKGQTRLSGFTGPAGYALILDGATGGNNAFAILALAEGYRRFGDVRYLEAAREIGRWIVGNLADTTGTGFGGYYLGYPDMGITPKTVQTAKSTENNADIFSALSELAAIETMLGNTAAATAWTNSANLAGDFVMAMYDAANKRFNAGTVPAGTPPTAGIDPTGEQRGNDVVNVFDFLDSISFPVLAMAAAPRYRNQIDWREPVAFVTTRFAQTIVDRGVTFRGFNIVAQATATPGDARNVPGPEGIAWEFTGQVVAAMRFVDALYGSAQFASAADFYLGEIARAQSLGAFGDGRGLVGATVQDGSTLVPLNQGVTTPFQFIPMRVGIPATAWAIFADLADNPLAPQFVAPLRPDSSATFVQSLYTDVLGRSAGAGEVLGWRQVLVNGGATPVANGVIRSRESYSRLVNGLYAYFLNRSPGAGESNTWLDRLERQGLTAEGLIVGFVASAEFAAAHPNDGEFVRTLGTLLLSRTLSNGEVDSILALLPGAGRAGVAARMLSDTEFRARLVRTLYGDRVAPGYLAFVPNLLQRTAPPTGVEVAGWVDSGLDLQGLEVALAASLEYFLRGGQPVPGIVGSLFRSVLLRPASTAEAAAQTSLFVASGSSAIVRSIGQSTEARNSLVVNWYGRYLGRSPGNNEQASWVDQFLTGATEEQVLSGILASAEFANRAMRLAPSTSSNESFVRALYLLVLERSAASDEVNGWLAALPNTGRRGVAQAFLSSAEYRAIAVRSNYAGLLHRRASAEEVAGWVFSSLDLAGIDAGFLTSLEFSLE